MTPRVRPIRPSPSCGRSAVAAVLVALLVVGPGAMPAAAWLTLTAPAQSSTPISEEERVAEVSGAGLPARTERRQPGTNAREPHVRESLRPTSPPRPALTFGPPVAAIRGSAGFPLRC